MKGMEDDETNLNNTTPFSKTINCSTYTYHDLGAKLFEN